MYFWHVEWGLGMSMVSQVTVTVFYTIYCLQKACRVCDPTETCTEQDKCKWEMEGHAWMTHHYTISGHNLDFVKQRNPTSIHPHALSGDRQQTGSGLQHCCLICIKVQCHNVWSSKSIVCRHMLMSIYVSHVVVLQYYNYTATHIHL